MHLSLVKRKKLRQIYKIIPKIFKWIEMFELLKLMDRIRLQSNGWKSGDAEPQPIFHIDVWKHESWWHAMADFLGIGQRIFSQFGECSRCKNPEWKKVQCSEFIIFHDGRYSKSYIVVCLVNNVYNVDFVQWMTS